MEILEKKIKNSKPSVTLKVLRKHEEIRKKFESDSEEDKISDKPKFGF